MNELDLTDVYAAAACATINARFAPAYLHDIRGSMQALVGAFELLSRSARAGDAGAQRVEKACELARRALIRHEKCTLETVQILAQQPVDKTAVDLGQLLNDLVHFLRNEAASKKIAMSMQGPPGLCVRADRARLQTVLVGLLSAALDAVPPGAHLSVSVERVAADVLVTIGSDAGYAPGPDSGGATAFTPSKPIHTRDLALLFARQFLAAQEGSLQIDADPGAIRIFQPIAGD